MASIEASTAKNGSWKIVGSGQMSDGRQNWPNGPTGWMSRAKPVKATVNATGQIAGLSQPSGGVSIRKGCLCIGCLQASIFWKKGENLPLGGLALKSRSALWPNTSKGYPRRVFCKGSAIIWGLDRENSRCGFWQRRRRVWLLRVPTGPRMPDSGAADRLDEFGEADLAFAAQPLGGEDRLHLLDRLSNVAVDDDVSYSAHWLISSAAFAILRRTTSSGS